jgi:hypothetical protein
MLQKEDPSGETEVCIDNLDIYFAERLEAYWDGRLQLLVHDEAKRGKCYSIVGAKVTSKGSKIRLHYMGVEDVIDNDPDAPVDLSEIGNEETKKEWEKRIAHWREETKRINEEIRREIEQRRKH